MSLSFGASKGHGEDRSAVGVPERAWRGDISISYFRIIRAGSL